MLVKSGEFVGIDGEALPVDDGARGVGDSECITGVIKSSLTAGDGATERVGLRV